MITRGVRIVLTGFIILVPIIVTMYLLTFALRLVHDVLVPIISVLNWLGVSRTVLFSPFGSLLVKLTIFRELAGVVDDFLAVIVLLGPMFVLGLVASFRVGERLLASVDAAIISIPGIGPIYKSFRLTGDVLLEGGLDDVRDVKVVEFPHEGLYAIGFVTSSSARLEMDGERSPDDDLVTLFVPLAPNPAMGGFLLYVPPDRLIDVDMTVEEAARSLITSGIASPDGEDRDEQGLYPFHLE